MERSERVSLFSKTLNTNSSRSIYNSPTEERLNTICVQIKDSNSIFDDYSTADRQYKRTEDCTVKFQK